MRDITIREYIGHSREVTAAEVRKLPEGTKVTIHSFDRRGTHTTLDARVWTGTSRCLRYFNYATGMNETKQIKKETDRLCYTIDAPEGGE